MVVTVSTVCFNVENICMLPTQCTCYMFRMIILINSNHFLYINQLECVMEKQCTVGEAGTKNTR